MNSKSTDLHQALLLEAQTSPSLVFLTGFHAVKHAIRFHAEITLLVTSNKEKAMNLCRTLSPDILPFFDRHLQTIESSHMQKISPGRLHWTEVWAVTKRPLDSSGNLLLSYNRTSPLVLLEDPKNQGNLGACIRTSAGLGASGLIVVGEADPWHPRIVQAASGLQFGLPIGKISSLEPYAGHLYVCDPEGEDLSTITFHPDSILLFGTEREGVTEKIKQYQATHIRIPMKSGVSSLNLAVSVGIVLHVAQSQIHHLE
jgi:TrmH family RNA methyltransferase